MKAEYATRKVIRRFPWLFLHLTSLKVHVVTLSEEFMFSASCDEEVWGTNVKLSKCLTCHQGPSNFAAIVSTSYIYVYLAHQLQTVTVSATSIFNQNTDPTDARIVLKQTKRWTIGEYVCERKTVKPFCNAAENWTECPPNVKLERYRSVWGALRRQTVTAWLLDCFACYTSHTQLFVRPLDPRNYDNLFFTHFVLTYDFSLTIFITLQL